MISEQDLFTLTVWSEARGETMDGKAAVAQVIMNRTAQKYESDGTITGTCIHPNQFDFYYFKYVNGRYQRVASTVPQAMNIATNALAEAKENPFVWGQCEDAVKAVQDGSYEPQDPAWRKLKDVALLYDNLSISQPVWATPEKFILRVDHHSFYRR
jgi:spore germination cell wall hydrolase CwlJ-like protein